MCMSRIHALYFMLHTSYSMCMYIPSACFSGSVYTSHVHYAVGSLPLANNAMHSPSWRAGASQPSRTAGSDFSIYILTGAAHTVIPIQRQHAHKIAISVYIYTYTFALETDIEGRCVSLQKTQWKRRHDYPDAEVETERGVPHSLRRRRKIVAALKLRGPESVDQLGTEIEERGVSIQKARHTMLALQKMSLATFHN